MKDLQVRIVKLQTYYGIVRIVWDLTLNTQQERIRIICAYVHQEIGKTEQILNMVTFNASDVQEIMAHWLVMRRAHMFGTLQIT
jgi:hypothetical protein